ncbi:efflux RND transporter periplasmic adaptor subunit [Prosthecomicrobium sp. N25]|uniref:efflux RND transporter periplasmic adaptor subunit n=1 Tax=Prosthecomicrobium sp. N25 TaxID=3129254 RepID=UPI00307804BC
MPPPEVGVLTTVARETPLPLDYGGRVAGYREVEVRARVSGLLLKRHFNEGTRVVEGQTLFEIDPATYRAAAARAEAQLAQAEATLRAAEENFRRADELVKRGVSTEKQRDDAQSARDQGRAAVQVADAELQTARLNLGYTSVTAPASGTTAIEAPPVGTLVQAQTTLLTTITPLDPAYVNFSFTDEEAHTFREQNAQRATPLTEKDLSAELLLNGTRPYPLRGRIDISAQRVDPQTGTIQTRAVFANPEGVLLPGQFVRVVIHGITLPSAIVIPAQAVSQGPQGPAVFVVGANDVAQARPIRLGRQLPDGWIVLDGLKEGERVVVDGVIRVRPGAPVRPVAWTPKAEPAPRAGGAAR